MTGTTSTRAGAYLAELFDVQNRIAVVIGGTSGLGEAAAVALGRCGARVVVAGRDNDRAEGVVRRIAELEGEASAHFVDVLDEASVGRLADEVHASHGAVDILVNAAGVFAMRAERRSSTSSERWSRIIDTNLTAHVRSAAVPSARRMLEAGRGRDHQLRLDRLASSACPRKPPTARARAAVAAAHPRRSAPSGSSTASASTRSARTDFATPMIKPMSSADPDVPRVDPRTPSRPGASADRRSIAGAIRLPRLRLPRIIVVGSTSSWSTADAP